MSMAGVAVAMWAASLGCGLALERLLRIRLANPLLLAIGLCAAIVVVYPGYAVGFGDGPSLVLLVAIAVAGFVVADGGILTRLNPGWPGAAGLATYLLFILPLIGAGHWTWSGYGVDNDTGFEMLLAQHLQSFGTHIVTEPANTGVAFVDNYLSNGYPLGAHALLATVSSLLDVNVAVAYQGFLAALTATGAIALATLAGRVLSPPLAAVAGVLAMGANLTYQYAMDGEIKEIAVLSTVCVLLALGAAFLDAVPDRRGGRVSPAREPLARSATGERDVPVWRATVPLAVALAATLEVYNAAALPYVGAFVLFLAIAVLLRDGRLPDRGWLAPVGFAAVATIVLATPALATIKRFYDVATAAQARSSAPGAAVQLGQLERQLPLSQITGVWLSGEYRLPILPEPAGVLTAIAAGGVIAALVIGLLLAVRRRQWGILLALATMGLVLLVVYPRVSPYAEGKLLAIASPIAVLVAAVALFSLPGRWLRAAGGALGAALALGILASDVLAYHADPIAPAARMSAMSQMADHFVGRGLVLWNEDDEFAKFFADRAQVVEPYEAYTPSQVALRYPVDFYGEYYDLDDLALAWVESFPNIVTRRSPAASRPPANYRLAYSNAYYLGWVREAQPVVLRHQPEQLAQARSAPLGCADARALVQNAPLGTELVVSRTPETVQYSTLQSIDRSPGWGLDISFPDSIDTTTPGHASGEVTVGGGRYDVWVQGSFPATLTVQIDGRAVGHVSGSQSVGQWAQAAVVQLAPGRHLVRVLRPAGRRHFGPGAGGTGTLGNVALQRAVAPSLVTVPLSRWRSLCGEEVDWVELVRP